jgi:hypothetical protein
MDRFYTGPFEGSPTIKPPALPEDTYSIGAATSGDLMTVVPTAGGSHGFSPEYPELKASLFAVGAGIARQRNPGVLVMRQRCGSICLGHTSTRNLSRGLHPRGDELLNFGHFSGSNYTILDRVAPKWSQMSRARNVTAKATGKKVSSR